MPPYQKMSSAYSDLTFDRENEHHYDLINDIPQKKRISTFGLKRRFIPVYLCIIISFLALSLSLFGFIKDYCFTNPENRKLEGACIPCAYLLNTQFREDVEIIIKYGEKTCCARTPARMQQMINEAFNRRITQLDDKVSETPERPKISPQTHKVSRSGDVALHNSDVVVHLPTTDQTNQGHNGEQQKQIKGADMKNTRLNITESGFYYIYSQVYFRIFTSNGMKLPGILGHQVFRYSDNVPNDGIEKLLETAQTTTEDKNRNVYLHSSYAGGVFKLDGGDQLYVIISHPSLTNLKLSFLGVIKLNM